ncbi:MAG: DNA (cytosine-5-)-methyltransferase [Parvularculaceae bacterium]
MPSYFEFFCGGGMVRAALSKSWTCALANDFDPKKGKSYSDNWGDDALVVADINNVSVSELSSRNLGNAVDLAWASFPCQDLSLAGGGAGLRGKRSGTFWPFHERMAELGKSGRAPTIVALENVCGALSSHEGKDFAAIARSFSKLGYRIGALVIDAAHFLPQSRPRLFFVCIKADHPIPDKILTDGPIQPWHPMSLRKAHARLARSERDAWIWWNLPKPRPRRANLQDIIEERTNDVVWHSREETDQLLAMMTEGNLAKVARAKAQGGAVVGTLFRRTRHEVGVGKVQRVEVRFDGKAGCLRTPAGGSSRQIVISLDGSSIRTRLMRPRECARLMGLPDTYRLPENSNEALHLTGDGVAVPAVRYIASHIFEPLLAERRSRLGLAA